MKTYSVQTSTFFTVCGESTPLFQCTASFTVVTEDEYGGYLFASSALLGVGVLVYFVARRRRQAADPTKEERKCGDGHFEMMSE